jgi:uncharacterized protein (TIGR02646 family)
MRFIEKGPSPDALARWLAVDEGQENLSYPNMPKAVKDSVRAALWREQFALCAYTMIRLETQAHCHIEHFVPQNPPRGTPVRSEGDNVAYANMLACYPANWPTGPKEQCGFGAMRRGNEPLSISPLETRCETSFHYLSNGKVEGLDEDARRAVDVLNLNHSKLQHMRAAAFQGRGLRFAADDSFGDFDLLPPAEAFALAREVLQPIDGMLAEFCVAIAQVAIDYARARAANG